MEEKIKHLEKNGASTQARPAKLALAEAEIKARSKGLPEATNVTPFKEAGAGVTKTPATLAAYLACALHEERGKHAVTRSEIIELKRAMLKKDQAILERDQKILGLELAAVEQDNEKLRETHGISFGRTIHKDDETGEVYWLDSPQKPEDSKIG